MSQLTTESEIEIERISQIEKKLSEDIYQLCCKAAAEIAEQTSQGVLITTELHSFKKGYPKGEDIYDHKSSVFYSSVDSSTQYDPVAYTHQPFDDSARIVYE